MPAAARAGGERPPYHELAPRPPSEGPVDLTRVLPGEGPLELDVGFGRGRSLLERARVAPEVRLVGVEVRPKWVVKLAERLEREALAERVRIWAADVRDLLPRCGPDGCLDRVFVHFPDPWWKKRHARRRVVDGAFVAQVARLLRPGGQLFVQTDVEDRALAYRDTVGADGRFELAGDHGFVPANPFGARSNREVRVEADGLPVWRLLATRR